jgi:hypothetical protein
LTALNLGQAATSASPRRGCCLEVGIDRGKMGSEAG